MIQPSNELVDANVSKALPNHPDHGWMRPADMASTLRPHRRAGANLTFHQCPDSSRNWSVSCGLYGYFDCMMCCIRVTIIRQKPLFSSSSACDMYMTDV